MDKTIQMIEAKLIEDGFNGLYVPGECACVVGDLAPCCEFEETGDYINGCEGGYKHVDPNNAHNFCVSSKKEPPNEQEWLHYRD